MSQQKENKSEWGIPAEEFKPFVEPLIKMRESRKDMTVYQLQAAAAEMAKNSVPPEDPLIEIRNLQVPVRDSFQVPIRVYIPKERKDGKELLPLVYVMHGGGWATGTLDTDDHVCRRYCKEIPAVVVNVDYRLAPDFPWPKGFEDAKDVLEWSIENASQWNADGSKVAVSGCSAGGNFSAGLSLLEVSEGKDRIKLQVLNQPCLHLDGVNNYKSYADWEHDAPILPKWRLLQFLEWYRGDAKDIFASPILAPSELKAKVAPSYITVCGMDPLKDECLHYAQQLRETGNTVEVEELRGYPHGATSFFTNFVAVKNSITRVVKLCQKYLQ
eukprot:TRINITY_DN3450_c0_g1_i1.p1 TRINITY_DN3450_c0_g1~~TRINITY_DN3450_c0_g1_i1.p1  ORF type:complete len:364 (+),score=93.44 TRINITY_DN3450_c0_g1_i1:110-1093(+)